MLGVLPHCCLKVDSCQLIAVQIFWALRRCRPGIYSLRSRHNRTHRRGYANDLRVSDGAPVSQALPIAASPYRARPPGHDPSRKCSARVVHIIHQVTRTGDRQESEGRTGLVGNVDDPDGFVLSLNFAQQQGALPRQRSSRRFGRDTLPRDRQGRSGSKRAASPMWSSRDFFRHEWSS